MKTQNSSRRPFTVVPKANQETIIEKKFVQQQDYYDVQSVRDADIANKISLHSSDSVLRGSYSELKNAVHSENSFDKLIVEYHAGDLDMVAFQRFEKWVKHNGMILLYAVDESESEIENLFVGKFFWYFKNRFANELRDVLVKIKK